MKLRNTLIVVVAILSLNTAYAQKVKLKGGKVLLENEQILTYESGAVELSLYELDNEEEIVFVQWMDNETSGYSEDDFIKIHFIGLDLVCEVTYGYGKKGIVNKLLKDKVLSLEGKFNEEKARTFVKKYDENITNRTIRY